MTDQGFSGSNPARFNFLIIFFFVSNLKGGGYLINKKLQIIVISLPQDSFLFLYDTDEHV